MTDTKLKPDGPDLPDPALGLPGAAEPLPDDDHLTSEPTRVNDETQEDDNQEGKDS